MATIGGLTNSTANSIRGYGGLASGMDRDTLIEGMTYGTTSKITQQQQKKQQLEWKQNAVRAISDMMIAFANKYTASLTSSSNLFSSMFWGRNNITTTGANSKFVSVTGTASAANAITIMGVKQMAKDAKWSSSEAVSDMMLQTGEVGASDSSALIGKTLTFSYNVGGTESEQTVTLKGTDSNGKRYNYSTADGIAKAINDQLSGIEVEGKKLNELVEFKANGSKIEIAGKVSESNNIKIKDASSSALDLLGFTANKDLQVSDTTLNTSTDDVKAQYVVQDLVGKTLDFKYGGSSYSVTLGLTKSDGTLYDYRSPEGIVAAINDQLSKVDVDDNTKLSKLVQFHVGANGKIEITGNPGSNELKVVGGDHTALDLLGFPSKEADGKKDKEWGLSSTAIEGTTPLDPDKLSHNITFAEKVAGKELTFSYNGTSKTIKMPTKEELNGTNDNEVIRKSIQEQLDSAFGKGRIKVELGTSGDDAGKLSFTTYNPSTNEKDTTSTLTIVSGSSDLVGANGVLGIKAGITNRVNMNETLVNAGLGLKDADFDANGNRDIKINGESITINKNDTVNSLMKKINNSGAGVAISYQTVGDKFTFTSTEKGASGSIKLEGTGTDKDSDEAFLNKLFGVKSGDDVLGSGVRGQDAVVAIKYNGSDDVVELIRDSNSFTVDGLSIGVKGTFGYKLKDDGTVETDPVTGEPLFDSDPVEIDARVNTDNIVDNIKSMVEEYNKIIELVNKELTTKPDRDYAPLTSEQKKELSESEIETWEEKAKSGLLYGDSDLRSLSSDLRFIISGGNMEELRKIGITTSTLYSDNGKLTLDESKLRAALETDPESVEKLFTSKAGVDADGNKTFDGIATNLKNVMDKYVKTLGSMDSKGILIKKAGSSSSPMSLTENAFYKQLSEINKQISKLQTRLESERDRYIKQFTSLETLISQMNSQSSWLSQLGGY